MVDMCILASPIADIDPGTCIGSVLDSWCS